MSRYTMITMEQANGFDKVKLISMYNDAIEMIWFLEAEVRRLSEENDSLWDSYGEISDKYFG